MEGGYKDELLGFRKVGRSGTSDTMILWFSMNDHGYPMMREGEEDGDIDSNRSKAY
jgi:hypothetical protein